MEHFVTHWIAPGRGSPVGTVLVEQAWPYGALFHTGLVLIS